jgi:probable HAF family extracellular repeat protein
VYPGVRAFIWQNGVMAYLGTLGGNYTYARAINNAGQVIGTGTTSPDNSQTHSYLWQNGVMTDLGTLGGINASAYAINSVGQVVGQSETSSGDYHAFLWQNGVMTDLGTLGGNRSSASAINNAGQIVGESTTASGSTHAFLWENGVMTDLGALGGDSMAYAVNNAGEAIGVSWTSTGEGHAVLWTNRTTQELLADLTTLVTDFNLPGSLSGNLLGKLNDASLDLQNGDIGKVCNDLNSFVNVTEAHSGKDIPLVQATQMIIAGQSIQKILGCM